MKQSMTRLLGAGVASVFLSSCSPSPQTISPLEQQKRDIIATMNHHLSSHNIRYERNSQCYLFHEVNFDGKQTRAETKLTCGHYPPETRSKIKNGNDNSLTNPFKVKGTIYRARIDVNNVLSDTEGCIRIEIVVPGQPQLPPQSTCPEEESNNMHHLPDIT